MKKTGHIEITDKVKFVYYELDKPIKRKYYTDDDLYKISVWDGNRLKKLYLDDMKEYEASKRTIEVSNVFWGNMGGEWLFGKKIKGSWENGPKNNQPCKAEVNEKAIIIELL